MPSVAAYVPDDAQITVAALEYLRTVEGGRLRRAVAELPGGGAMPTVAEIAGLRKRFAAEAVHAALALAKLQPKAAGPGGKFPEMAYVWATPEALEQATHARVGRYKAGRLAQWGAGRLARGPGRIFDLCAGIGGDALALAEVAPVTAVEISAVRAACLRFNALERGAAFPLEVRNEDLRGLIDGLPAEAWVHIDPARRSAGRRSARYEDLMPGPEVLERIFGGVGGHGGRAAAGGSRSGAIKLSSAVDFASLPAGHVELISHEGAVVQAVLWMGTGQAAAERTATVLGGAGAAWSLTAVPREVVVGRVPAEAGAPAAGRAVYLYEVDGAVTRAGLAGELAGARGLLPLTVDGGYLRGLPGAGLVKEAALTAFRVRGMGPFGQVGAMLAKCADVPGVVEVKARGRLPGIDTDQLQRAWTKAHGVGCTVLLFRREGEVWAAVAVRA